MTPTTGHNKQRYILDLLLSVIAISVKTVEIVKGITESGIVKFRDIMEKEIVDNKTKNETALMDKYKALMRDTVIRPDEDYCDKIKGIRDLIDANTPKKLYRFRTFDNNSLDAYWKNKIYHSFPKTFNDPHDCLVYVDQESIRNSIDFELNQLADKDYLSERLTKYDVKDKEVEQALEKELKGKTIEDIHKQILDNIEDVRSQINNIIGDCTNSTYNHFQSYPKIACFTENIHSTLMWAHYANYHKGFALEYDFTCYKSPCVECKSMCNNFTRSDLYPVIYSENRYDATDLTGFLCINKLREKLGLSTNNDISDQLAYVKANVYKGKDWEYEQEWRSILVCDRMNSSRSDVAIKPKAIYIGAETPAVHEDILINYARAKRIDIYKMKVDFHSKQFKLSYDKIE